MKSGDLCQVKTGLCLGHPEKPIKNKFVLGAEREVPRGSVVMILSVEEGGSSVTDYVRFMTCFGPLYTLRSFLERDVEVL
jgi:hypothetical protein